MRILPIYTNKQDTSTLLWDNADRIRRILYRFKAHGKFFFKALNKGVPLRDLLVARFPFLLKEAQVPPSMHVELTDACNLKCVYCNNPGFAHPRQMMNEQTVQKLCNDLERYPVSRICLGGGEPTLHPQFISILARIRKQARILTIVSNAQWENDAIAEGLVQHIDMIEISVDAGGKETYERSRPGADYERLKRNLKKLKEYKARYRSSTQINIRLMMRPSTLSMERTEKKFWSEYCDTIMPQYILKLDDVNRSEDVFISKYTPDTSFPKCSIVFKNLQVRATFTCARFREVRWLLQRNCT